MKTREDKIFNVFGHIFMILLTVMAIVPIVLMVISSLTSNGAVLRNGYSFFPEEWSTYAYEWIFASNGGVVLKAYGISFFITAIGTTCSLLLTIGLAYGLSKKGLPGRGIFTFLVVFTMLFNGGLVPTYINYTNVFHIRDTIYGLLIPSLLMNAFNILLMKSYFVTGVPDEILEAARIDGANEFFIFHRIIFPMAKNGISSIAIFQFLWAWEDYLWPYLIISTKEKQLLAVGLKMFSGQYSTDYGALFAATAISIIPVLLIYIIFQKQFIAGVASAAVKG